MERTDILELMSTLKLYGMRAAYDEVMTTGIKRRHEPPRIVGDLLSAEKQARSIKYQLTIAKLPLAKDIDDFDFIGTSRRGNRQNEEAGTPRRLFELGALSDRRRRALLKHPLWDRPALERRTAPMRVGSGQSAGPAIRH
jgi:hypothetical protein